MVVCMTPYARWPGAAPLVLVNHTKTPFRTHPALGSYSVDTFEWVAADQTRLQTSIAVFDDGETALFGQKFHDGVASSAAKDGPVLAFPAFTNASGADGLQTTKLGAISWVNAFSQDVLPQQGAQGTNAVQLDQLPQATIGRSSGGPVIVFDEDDHYTSLIVSPFQNFLASAQYTAKATKTNSGSSGKNGNSGAPAWWSLGISGSVTTVHPGFEHATILSAGVGITGGLQSWGGKMRATYNTSRTPDISLSHLSYWTDNGAYYYMHVFMHAFAVALCSRTLRSAGAAPTTTTAAMLFGSQR